MSKIYVFLILILCLNHSFGQDIEIYKHQTSIDVSGTTIYAKWNGAALEHQQTLIIKNTSNSSKILTLKRAKIIEAAGATEYLCWLVNTNFSQGAVYPSDQVSPFNPWTSPDALTFISGEEGTICLHYIPNGNYNQSKYRYYIEENGIAIDSIDVIYSALLSTPEKQQALISVFPNPANDLVNITAENIGISAEITIFDISGKVVLERSFSSGKTQLNISGLNVGVYFYSIKNGSNFIETKKLLIQ